MGVAVLICMVLLMDHAAAQQLKSQENYSPAQGGPRYSNHSLDCGDGSLVLIVDVEIVFLGSPCCGGVSCSFAPSAADLQRYIVACGNSSRCSLSIEDLQGCGEITASPQLARIFYICSSASTVLAMDSSDSTSGRTVAARFSSPDLQSSNSSWQCRVEASDCSNLTSTVELIIRNAEQQSSSFFSTSYGERLGKFGLQSTETTPATPFAVDLHLVNGSLVQPAYVIVAAGINISMTCGIRNTTPATFCNQCASSPCPEGFECVNLPGNFSCVDIDECKEVPSRCDVTEHCNNTEGSFHCSCRHGYRRADDGGRCLDIDECARNPPPCDVTARCNNTEGSFHCYCDPGFLLTDNSTACVDVDECDKDPSPCDVTARCNNTEGSFHCYCDPGFNLIHSGTPCMEPSPPGSPPRKFPLGVAVGVSVAALVFIILIVIIACFCRRRSQKKQDEDVSLRNLEASRHQGCPNNAYEVRLSERNSQHRDNVGTVNAVTSEGDSTYDVLFQKRPTADKKPDVIYGHLGMKGSPHDNVEGKDTCAGNAKGPGVPPDPIYFTVEPESPAAQTKQDDGSNLKMEVKAASLQNGGGEGRLVEGHQRAEVKGAECDFSRM